MIRELKTRWMVLLLCALAVALVVPARAADPPAAGNPDALASLWLQPDTDGKLSLLVAGKPDPVVTKISPTTVFAAICLDCGLPMEFPSTDVTKKCAVCGCEVSNASCVVGKPVKTENWQSMMKLLPRGVALQLSYVDSAKPEAGIAKIKVDLRHALLSVTGLDGQTPGQLLMLVKPLGGIKAELIDAGKRLSIEFKADWTVEKELKLEKALEGVNAKVVVPDAPKPAT